MTSLQHVTVQRFDHLFDPTPSADVLLGDVLTTITNGTYAGAIERVRDIFATDGEDAYRKAKEALAQITFAGTFAPTRAKEHLVQASGLCHADIDHLANLPMIKYRLMQDPSVAYCFTSPRGDGLKYGVRIPPVGSDEAYKHAWKTLAAVHLATYGVTWDRTGKDICRLCFVTWDPACYVNLDAECYDDIPPPMITPPPPPRPVSTATPRTRRDWYAQRGLTKAAQLIAESVPGHQHAARCRAAYLLGGYVAGGLLTEADAYAALEPAVEATAKNTKKAMKDIADCLEAGRAKPITLAELEAEYQFWRRTHVRRVGPTFARADPAQYTTHITPRYRHHA